MIQRITTLPIEIEESVGEDPEHLRDPDGELLNYLNENVDQLGSIHLDTFWSSRNSLYEELKEHMQDKQEAPTVFDVVVAEENNGKTYWRTLGVAFPLASGAPGLSIKLFMFPNLRLVAKETLRPVGSARANAHQSLAPDTPF